MSEKKSTRTKPTSEEIDFVKSLLPDGTVAPLFESETCLFCKGDHPHPKECYGIVDMGHAEPESNKTSAIGIKVKAQVGSLVSVQIACCNSCRKNYMISSMIGMITAIIVVAAGLLVLSIPSISTSLLYVNEALPLILFLISLPLAYLLGKLFSTMFVKSKRSQTQFNVMKIPFMKRMEDFGWFPINRINNKRVNVIFSKKRLTKGWFID